LIVGGEYNEGNIFQASVKPLDGLDAYKYYF
jgi:hypothetical protein